MGEFPYYHDEKPDARRRWEKRRALPVLAAAAAGLAIGTFFESGQGDRQPNAEVSAPALTAQPSCRAETQWQTMPNGTNWRFLAMILDVDEGRAQASKMAAVKCDEGIAATDMLSSPIEVDGQNGPCLPLDLLKATKVENPFVRHKEVFAICAGDEATI